MPIYIQMCETICGQDFHRPTTVFAHLTINLNSPALEQTSRQTPMHRGENVTFEVNR